MVYLSEHNYIKQASIDRDRAIEESDRKVKQASDEPDRIYKLARARGNYWKTRSTYAADWNLPFLG